MEPDILVVDDSAAMRKILQRVLRQTVVRIRAVHEASDGQEALELIKNHPVDVIFTDINMPRMDGFQFLTALKNEEQWRNIPVLVVTTEGSEAMVGEAQPEQWTPERPL